MSEIRLAVFVYAPCLSKTTIKTNKKQLNSSADTFFLITPYILRCVHHADYSSARVFFLSKSGQIGRKNNKKKGDGEAKREM